jgi:Gas vesicle protein G
MLLVDNVLGAPARGLVWVFREVQKAAEQSLREEYQAITAELSKLYLLLESGAMGEAEFNTREQRLLDRMDELEDQGYGVHGDESGNDD